MSVSRNVSSSSGFFYMPRPYHFGACLALGVETGGHGRGLDRDTVLRKEPHAHRVLRAHTLGRAAVRTQFGDHRSGNDWVLARRSADGQQVFASTISVQLEPVADRRTLDAEEGARAVRVWACLRATRDRIWSRWRFSGWRSWFIHRFSSSASSRTVGIARYIFPLPATALTTGTHASRTLRGRL